MRGFLAALLVVFSGYTLYCVYTESLVKSAQRIWTMRWGRQVTADLYVGLILLGFVIYLNQPEPLVAAAWILAALVVGNPVTLAYFVLHYHDLVGRF